MLQAVVFGAAHANYPGFPPYSRLVELVVPSMLWAAIFLRFGLLPTILLHALFDLALFSIPLYLVDAPGAWVQRAAVVVGGAGAAGGGARGAARARRLGRAAAVARRTARGRRRARCRAAKCARRPAVASRAVASVQRSLPALGVAGLVAWIAFTPTHATCRRCRSTARAPRRRPTPRCRRAA